VQFPKVKLNTILQNITSFTKIANNTQYLQHHNMSWWQILKWETVQSGSTDLCHGQIRKMPHRAMLKCIRFTYLLWDWEWHHQLWTASDHWSKAMECGFNGKQYTEPF